MHVGFHCSTTHGVITDTGARIYVVEYSKERYDGFWATDDFYQAFFEWCMVEQWKPTCAVVLWLRLDSRVVHSSNFWLIFSSFLSIWQRNKQKGTKNGMENDVENGYCEHPGMGILEKWSKFAFFCQAQGQKDEKWSFFSSLFAKARLGFHFAINFLSFSVSILRKMETKWNGKWFKNEWKMDWKCQLWTTLLLWFSSPHVHHSTYTCLTCVFLMDVSLFPHFILMYINHAFSLL